MTTDHNSGGALYGGVLYIVATPIGNLADMVPRAIEILQAADLIAAEDTRHSRRLLDHFNITTAMQAYHDFSDGQATERLLTKVKDGQKVALISDAGTPLISDPGFRLVQSAREQGIQVVPVPGACALIAALCASGLPTNRFRFEGFLPAKPGTRANRLETLAGVTETLVFYEAPHRIEATLGDIATVFGQDRRVVLARELTKTFETFLDGTAESILKSIENDPNQRRGEMVLMVAGAEPRADQTLDDDTIRLMAILTESLPVKQAAQLAAEYTGLKKKTLYQWAIDQKGD
ncbi:16S rRNA (cytidine(1402)-2'-O)-methyltransferase [Marinibactrum halimedae]|uniref:Ribosomal RNA small subunit methyltransferase I n=1 Tax=Marinibactrum halimedae TaxID=1444977 RepID=A0AA37T7S7_9GAMM|nr:16S rRNA (cytidine(1402)-2'-O)-methyltransferase [Marinibactrum halimedae]MCD9460143.1 16S rRNA (cytidine(1402)-2'-O)-methyltransferase [Marinibactrum halimedae]GLS26387.1 ribosomal RNA small subunit methyltransferase I [Marinibactrum halimedae]